METTSTTSAANEKEPMETTIFISDADQYVFGQGTHYDIYKKLGAHPCKKGKKDGVFFAVWAPNAKEVYVIGEFNGWNESASPMERLGEGGIYATFVEGVNCLLYTSDAADD